MNDTFYEQLVKKKSSPLMPALKVLLICVLAAALILALFFVGFWPAVLIIILAFLLYYFVFPLLAVEYEYTLLNYDVDIDAVYSKTKRRHKLSFDLRTAEVIAPAGSEALASCRSAKCCDFTSRSHPENVYAVVIASGQSRMTILLEPDETTLRHLRQWGGSKFRDH